MEGGGGGVDGFFSVRGRSSRYLNGNKKILVNFYMFQFCGVFCHSKYLCLNAIQYMNNNVHEASIAQWQSTGLVNQGSRVQSSLEALFMHALTFHCPLSREYLCKNNKIGLAGLDVFSYMAPVAQSVSARYL